MAFIRASSSKEKKEANTLLSMLQSCARRNDLCEGTKIHREILSKGLLEKSFHLGSCLISMYAKCGALGTAQRVLDDLPVRNEASWNALISGFAQQEHGKDAMDCFESMLIEGFLPQPITFTCLLKACGDDTEKGNPIHCEVARLGFLEKDAQLGNALMGLYAKCGDLGKAREVMEKLPVRDEASWNTLISAYARQGQEDAALLCFEEMKRQNLAPNLITFISVLKACSSLGDVETGRLIHIEIANTASLRNDVALRNALVDMYAACGALCIAREVLDGILARDVVTWTGLISGYTRYGRDEEALDCFARMRNESLSPNTITFACILKACGAVRAFGKGKQIHGEIMSNGLLVESGDIVLETALMDMYARCGSFSKAENLSSEHPPTRDVTYWNALISRYTQHDQAEEALKCFESIQCKSSSPNVITFVNVLNACSSMGATEKGKEAHGEIVCRGYLVETCVETCVVLGSALVDMYFKCGLLSEAQHVHDELPVRDVVTWNAVISGYVQAGQGEEALACFTRMGEEGFSPDVTTLACIVKACGSTGHIEKGKEIHDEMNRKGWLGKHIMLGNALINMYAKCGALANAKDVIDALPSRDNVSWSTLISAYAQQGQGEEALNCFERMKCDGIAPNAITFLSVLNACSHSGFVDRGQMHFEDMKERYGITPDLDHLACMVDLFGRAGHFDKAMAILKRMPLSNYAPAWRSLLGACRKWANVKLGRLAFDEVVQLDSNNPAIYIAMANIYTAAGMKADAEKIEAMRIDSMHYFRER